MERKLFAVRDVKVSEYSNPMYYPSEIHAVRDFEQAAKNKETNIGRYPGDFELYQIAVMDSVTGRIEHIEPTKFIISAASLANKKEGKK